jgi:hypothetical protein
MVASMGSFLNRWMIPRFRFSSSAFLVLYSTARYDCVSSFPYHILTPKLRAMTMNEHELFLPIFGLRTWRRITTMSSSSKKSTSSSSSSTSLQQEGTCIHAEYNNLHKVHHAHNNNHDNHNNSDDDSRHDENEQIHRVTRDWLERIVVGWNLCPFADRPNREKTLELFLVRGQDVDVILNLVLNVCNYQHLNPGTSLCDCPRLSSREFCRLSFAVCNNGGRYSS